MPRFFGGGHLGALRAESGIFEDQGAAVTERNFFWPPIRALVERVWLGVGWGPFLVKPVQVRLVIGDPFLDGLPGWLDGLHGLDVERWRGRAREMDNAQPEAVEAEEELDFLAADHGAVDLHRPVAAGADERVAAPHSEDEVAPEGAHVAGPAFGRRGDKEDLGGCWRFFGWRLGLGWPDDSVRDGGGLAAGFVGVDAVVTDSLLTLGWNVVDGGGDEVVGFEDLEVTPGSVVPLGAVDDGLGGGVPSDFLQGEGMAEEILGQAFATGGVVGGHGFFAAVVDREAGVFPGEEVGEFAGADEFGIAQGVEEAVAEEFDGGCEVFGGHAVEAAVGGEESVGGKDMEVGVIDQVIAEGVDSGDGSDAAVGEGEAGAKGILKGGSGGVEQVGEEVAALAKDAAQDLGDGEDELAVGDLVADGVGDPFADGAGATLVAGGAEVAALAGEGVQAFVAAVWALETCEAGGEVAATEEGLEGGDGVGAEWAEGLAVLLFVVCEEIVPAVVDELPER